MGIKGDVNMHHIEAGSWLLLVISMRCNYGALQMCVCRQSGVLSGGDVCGDADVVVMMVMIRSVGVIERVCVCVSVLYVLPLV